MKRMLRPLSIFTLLVCFAAACSGADRPDRTGWLRAARWGVMSYYLAEIRAEVDQVPINGERWNYLVDRFDVEAVATQLEAVGAGYYMTTLGQASGYYLATNATYDRIVGNQPGKTARRDLVADLGTALKRRGIRLMVNFSSRAPTKDPAAVKALEWRLGPYRNREFQLKWESVVREWSQRWGPLVSGWWFESCNWPNSMYRHADAPNFESFAAAARSGNPDAIVAFNPGVVHRALSLTPVEDFIGGEIIRPEQWTAPQVIDGKNDGAQLHVVIDLGPAHGKGPPRFSTEEVVAFSRKVTKLGGVITWEAPVQSDGRVRPEFYAQLQAIGAAMKSAK